MSSRLEFPILIPIFCSQKGAVIAFVMEVRLADLESYLLEKLAGAEGDILEDCDDLQMHLFNSRGDSLVFIRSLFCSPSPDSTD